MSKLYDLLNAVISKVNGIPSAVSTALEQAKASGEFKGDKGDAGKDAPQDAIRYSAQTLTEAQKAQARDNIGASGIYNEWELIKHEEIEGKAVTSSLNTNGVSSAKYTKVTVDSYVRLSVTGYQWVTSYGYALCVFEDAQNKPIAYTQLTSNTQYTDYEIDVPENALYAYVNGNINNIIKISGLKKYDCKVLSEQKANRIAEWVKPTVTASYTGKGITKSNSTFSHSNARYSEVDVRGYKRVRGTAYLFSSNYYPAAAIFLDASNKVLYSYEPGANNSTVGYNLEVPEGAVTFKVNGHVYDCIESKLVESYKIFDVEDVYNEMYEIARPRGKRLMTLGDSITALGITDTGWIKYFIEKTGGELVANVAVNGAVLKDSTGTTYDGNPTSDNQTNNTLGNQVQKIINSGYSAPDIIIISIGTNGGISITQDQIKGAYYSSSNDLIALGSVDRTSDAGAYRWCLEKLHATYPNALIFWCTPIMGYQATRSAENAMAWAESLRIATEYTGQMMIDTIRCGINGVNEKKDANGQYLVDGLHPNANGAKKIGYYNAAKVIPFLGNSFALT